MITKLETYHLYMYFKALKARAEKIPEEKRAGGKTETGSISARGLFLFRQKSPSK
jgi:hypothetical protein